MKKNNKIMSFLVAFILAIMPLINVEAVDLNSYNDVVLSVAQAGEQFNITNWIDKEQSYVKINGTELDTDTIGSFVYNSSVDFFMVWKIPNSAKGELSKELYYTLPDNVRFNGNSGTLKDGGTVVGTWEIVDGKVLINYNDDFIGNLEGNNDLVGTLHIYGALGIAEPENNSGEDITISFPGFKDFNVHVEKPNVYSDLNINKYVTNGDTVSDTLEDREFVIEITSQGSAYNNIVITDTMGDALELNSDIELYDKDNNLITDFSWQTTTDGFEVTIPNIPANTSYYLKYKVSVLDDYVNTGQLVDGVHYESESNVAVMKSDGLDYNKTVTSYINITKYKLYKQSNYDIDNKIMNYTITVNGGYRTDMEGSILTDVLSENQDYIVGSFYVEVNGVKTEVPGLTFEILKTGYMFPGDSDDMYTIHYQTKVQDTGITVSNDASLFIPEQGETKVTTTDTYIPKELDLIKKAIAYDEENKIITWETQLVISEEIGTLSYININDTFQATKMKYVEGSFKINLDSFDPSFVTPSAWGGFTVFLGTTDPGQTDKFIEPGVYTMTYQTQITETMVPGTNTYNNNISFEYNGGRVSADAVYTVEVPENIMNKVVIRPDDNSQYFYNIAYDDEYLIYVLEVEQISQDVETFLISDIIPEGTSYVEGSAKFLGEDGWAPLANGDLDVKLVDDGKISFIFSEETNSRFFTELKRDDLRYGKNYITYKLKFDGELYGSHQFKNTAYAVVDGEQYPEVGVIVDRDLGEPIEKSYIYNEGTAPIVTYTIKINPNGGDLNPNSDTLEVTDISSSGLDFVRGSLTINGEKTNDYQYDDETHELTFSVPDSTIVEVTYRSYVNLTPGTNFTIDNSTNTIKISGITTDQQEDSTSMSGKVYEANGTTSGVGNSITIYKYLNNDLTSPLGRIDFNIYRANTMVVNGVITVDESNPYGELFKTVTTASLGDIGYARVSGMSADAVYILSEVESDDYIAAEDIYFVVTGHDNNTYDSKIVTIASTENNHTFNINNEEKPTKVTVQVEKREETEDGKLLSGATLQLIDINGDVLEEWVTTDSAYTLQSDLIIGQTYTLHEVSAPEGYEKAKDKEFTVEDTEETQIITMVDKKQIIIIVPKVEILKVDESGKALAGATLQLYDSQSVLIEEWESTTEAKQFVTLKAGETYTLKEVSAPEGYEISEPISFTVEEKDEVQLYKLMNIKSPTELTISVDKVDETGAYVDGAVLQIKDLSGNVIESWTSDGTRHIVESDLVIGQTYILTEITAPDGYEKAEDKEFTVQDTEEEQLITMIDIKAPTQTLVKIIKQDSDEQALAGAKLQLYDSQSVLIEEWESTTEPKVFTNLIIGETYRIHEVSAPEGYEIAEDVTFTVKDTEEEQVYKMTDKKTDIVVPIVTKISISKLDEAGNLLPGASMQIIDEEGNVVANWTTTTKTHEILGVLSPGKTYTLQEVSAPTGYQLAEDIKLVIIETNDVQKFEMINVKTKVTVKVDKKTESGTHLVGAKLQLVDKSGNVIEEWTTDGTSHTIETDLVIGDTYTIKEVEAPEGYETALDQRFVVHDTEEEQVITVIDAKIPTKITVQINKETDNGTSLKGAKLQIINEQGTIIEEWLSDGNPHVVSAKLEIGETYTIHEVEAPEGFELAQDIVFTVKDTEDIQEYTMIDIKIPTELVVQISKYSDTGELLSGAKLQILDNDNNVIEEWVTDGKVHTITADLVIGKTYILHEVSAPEGYKLAKDIEFTIEDTNDVQEIKMINVKRETIVSPDTGDNGILTYVVTGILSLFVVLIGGYTINKLKRKEV